MMTLRILAALAAFAVLVTISCGFSTKVFGDEEPDLSVEYPLSAQLLSDTGTVIVEVEATISLLAVNSFPWQDHESITAGVPFKLLATDQIEYVKKLSVTFHDQDVPIPTSAIFDLFHPTSLTVSGTSEQFTITLSGSTGSNRWVCELVFNEGSIVNRTLYDPAFVGAYKEDTQFTIPRFD